MIILQIFWVFFLECWRSNILNTLQIITIYNNFEVKWSVIKHSEDIKPQKYLSKNKKGTHEKNPYTYIFKNWERNLNSLEFQYVRKLE